MEFLYVFLIIQPPVHLSKINFSDRLENEHLGNMDQYRVTREVPLPYTFDDHSHETDIDEDDARSVASWRSKRKGLKPKPSPHDSHLQVQTPESAT